VERAVAAVRDPGGAGLSDADPRVREVAVAALVRDRRAEAQPQWQVAATDSTASVRRRAAEVAPLVGPAAADALLILLGDDDALVAEAAAAALGELDPAAREPAMQARVVDALISATAEHADPLVREAAVAALGSLGDARGLGAILAACEDRPAIRRRAVLALAPFDGPEVDAALARALVDSDWQVRQAAEDLTGA
jgi:HEAT repeat protein